MLLFGSGALIALVAPAGPRPSLARRFRVATRIAIVIAVLTTVLMLPLAAASDGDGLSGFDPALLYAMLGARIGEVWVLRVALAGVLAALALAGRDAASRALLIASGALLTTLALTGHAAMRGGWAGDAQQANQALHLLCAAFWLGGLAPLPLTLRDLGGAPGNRDAMDALRRYSLVGQIAVALVIVTGAINTRLILHAWPLDWRSPYQGLLAAKIALVGPMAVVALVNRYRLAPLLRDDARRAAAKLARNVWIELALGGCVLALVTVFATLDPA